MTDEQVHDLATIEQQITEGDHHIVSLQMALKEAKKAREEKVSQMRGLIRDANRLLFQAEAVQ